MMVERGPVIGPKHQHGGTANGALCRDRRLVGMEQRVHRRRQRPDRPRSQGAKRARGAGWFLRGKRAEVARIGLEAGPLSQWLHAGLVEAGLPAILIETRHVKAALKAMTVKTDRNDARAMAKALLVQEIRALLTARKLLVAKLRDIEGSLRGILRGLGAEGWRDQQRQVRGPDP